MRHPAHATGDCGRGVRAGSHHAHPVDLRAALHRSEAPSHLAADRPRRGARRDLHDPRDPHGLRDPVAAENPDVRGSDRDADHATRGRPVPGSHWAHPLVGRHHPDSTAPPARRRHAAAQGLAGEEAGGRLRREGPRPPLPRRRLLRRAPSSADRAGRAADVATRHRQRALRSRPPPAEPGPRFRDRDSLLLRSRRLARGMGRWSSCESGACDDALSCCEVLGMNGRQPRGGYRQMTQPSVTPCASEDRLGYRGWRHTGHRRAWKPVTTSHRRHTTTGRSPIGLTRTRRVTTRTTERTSECEAREATASLPY